MIPTPDVRRAEPFVAVSRVVFLGFTTLAYTGNLGRDVGANATCSAEFPGSARCTAADYDNANTTVGPGASGAWVDESRSASGRRAVHSCFASGSPAAWTYGGPAPLSSGQSASVTSATGTRTSAICNPLRPLACCARR